LNKVAYKKLLFYLFLKNMKKMLFKRMSLVMPLYSVAEKRTHKWWQY